MEYLLLIFSNESDYKTLSDAQRQEMSGAYAAYTEALQKAGVLRAGQRCARPGERDHGARALGHRGAERPYAETCARSAATTRSSRRPTRRGAVVGKDGCPAASHGRWKSARSGREGMP